MFVTISWMKVSYSFLFTFVLLSLYVSACRPPRIKHGPWEHQGDFLAEICVMCQGFITFSPLFAEEMWFKCVADCSNGIRVSLTPYQVVVVLYVQRQRPVANIVLCYRTLSSMLYSIVDKSGYHVFSCDRHHNALAAQLVLVTVYNNP